MLLCCENLVRHELEQCLKDKFKKIWSLAILVCKNPQVLTEPSFSICRDLGFRGYLT